ncbi:MAG: class I SAM-dependent methyltransferase [Gemmatimonadales bacterium]|nr:MAG: class I SAM-dependent methyltransferase [Gemmatimonadales bacterium]
MKDSHAYPGSELELFSQAVNWKGYLRDQIRGFLGPAVLEVGAGIGATTTALCRGEQERWVCLEPDPRMADGLRSRLRDRQLPACCEVAEGTTADLGDAGRDAGAFDTVLYVDVLEHIEEDQEELRRASGLLAPGGHLVVLAPAHSFLFTEFDRAIGHFRRYGRSDLVGLEPPGLELAEARYLDSVGLFASLGNRLLLRSAMPTPSQIWLWDRVMVPASRITDRLTLGHLGKSVLVAWRSPPLDRVRR